LATVHGVRRIKKVGRKAQPHIVMPSEQGAKHDQETESISTHHHFAICYFSGS